MGWISCRPDRHTKFVTLGRASGDQRASSRCLSETGSDVAARLHLGVRCDVATLVQAAPAERPERRHSRHGS